MTGEFGTTETLTIDDSEENLNIQDRVDDFSSELSGYKMNSEMEKAWISEIVPPNSSHPKSEQRKVYIKFKLPSKDVFWEDFKLPNNRWPEDNEFRKFIESKGVYSPDELQQLLGKEVDIVYDEHKNRWRAEMVFEEESNEVEKEVGDSTDVTPKITHRTAIKFFRVSFGFTLFLMGIMAIAVLRHIGLPIALLLIFVSYFLLAPVINNINN